MSAAYATAGAAAVWEPLVAFILTLRPYLRHLGRPLRIPAGQESVINEELLRAIFISLDLGAPLLTTVTAGCESAIETLIGSRLLEFLGCISSTGVGTCDLIRGASAEVAVRQLQHAAAHVQVVANDGVELDVRAHGSGRERAVIVIGPRGVPASIMDRWIGVLSKHHDVFASETRGFAAKDSGQREFSMTLQAQARDVSAIIDHLACDAST